MRLLKIIFAGSCISAMALSGCTAAQTPTAPQPLSKEAIASQIGEAATETTPPSGQQWLYGSAEADVILRQSWDSIASYVENTAKARPKNSVVLGDGSDASRQSWLACGTKPLAAVFDADETLIWNVGAMRYMAERGMEFDPQVWDSWEKTGAGKALAIPGALEAFARMRKAGVTMIANTNRSNVNSTGSEATLAAAGFGNFEHGKTLFLRGDAPDGSGKDGRRAIISKDFCVIALVGDQLGDIADIFNAKELTVKQRKALTNQSGFADKWGKGWFLLPNPVYGPSIRGEFDDVFTPETSWSPELEN